MGTILCSFRFLFLLALEPASIRVAEGWAASHSSIGYIFRETAIMERWCLMASTAQTLSYIHMRALVPVRGQMESLGSLRSRIKYVSLHPICFRTFLFSGRSIRFLPAINFLLFHPFPAIPLHPTSPSKALCPQISHSFHSFSLPHSYHASSPQQPDS